MPEIIYLRDNEYPTSEGSWVLIVREGPVWTINSAATVADDVPVVPIGEFHLLGDILAQTVRWASATGIERIYIRSSDDSPPPRD